VDSSSGTERPPEGVQDFFILLLARENLHNTERLDPSERADQNEGFRGEKKEMGKSASPSD